MASYRPLTDIPLSLLTNSGTPANGYVLYAYVSGTTTPATLYEDATGTVAGSSVTLDARGEPTTIKRIWLDTSITYKLVLKANTGTVWTADPVYGGNPASLGTFLQSGSGAVTREAQAKLRESVSVADFGGDPNAANNSAAITAALAAAHCVVFTDIYPITSTITVPNGRTLIGLDRTNCGVSYTGTGCAFVNSNPVNGSGYADVKFKHLKISTSTNSNEGAAISLESGGWSYFHIEDVWIAGKFKCGIILDASEIVTIKDSLIEGSDTYTEANIWIVNGDDLRTSQSTGYTNIINIYDNQLSGGKHGIVDDGGNVHNITGNNFNAHSRQMQICGATNFCIEGNSFETTKTSADSNVTLSNYCPVTGTVNGAALTGKSKSACTVGTIRHNEFAGAMSASGSMIKSAGAMHSCIDIAFNTFEDVLGRGNAIDDSYLKNSFIGYNTDNGGGGVFHYYNPTGSNNNTRLPPQQGASVLSQGVHEYTRSDKIHRWGAGHSPGTDKTLDLGSTSARWGNTYINALSLVDGVTAPSTSFGNAYIYVDTADGDLKIKFGDGTVKTIVTDT